MTRLFVFLRRENLHYWFFGFLFINFFLGQLPSPNPNARWATLVSLAEEETFQIDALRMFTLDWAHAPNGHYYSNKAPGPVLLALPLFLVLDRVATWDAPSLPEARKKRLQFREGILWVLSFLIQAIPFAIVAGFALMWLERQGVKKKNLHWIALALLFGNTAALFMNSFFGHGMAATFFLASVIFLLEEKYWTAGFLIGGALLCDYSSALFLLPLAVFLPRAKPAFLGVFLAALFLGWYHFHCFGSPWALPAQFQNPQFVEAGRSFDLPSPMIALSLLFGPRRGLLFTQPWVFILFPFAFRSPRVLSGYVLGSFLLLLLMNSSFGNWHGGNVAGPRYLSTVLPALVLFAPFLDGHAWKFFKVGVAISVLFFIVVFATQLYAPPEPTLLVFYLSQMSENPVSRTAIRFAIVAVGLTGGTVALLRSSDPLGEPA